MAQTETPLSSDAGPLQAVWRHTTAMCGQCERIEVGFALPDGGVLRVSLSSGDARHLAETLAGFLADGPLPAGFVCRPCHAGVQSARSAGSPHLSDSMPPGIANV